ncbi:hypothetical protein F4561_002781 [Lipingzhangella halophila]|uniref:Uncharacterized protein n=1 Tax=Lipingzhangella halophila TaxID=1783352 RepID=A0A7W7RIA7_9ACTN|nr:hypothetical protein [Lipingzhangella halophila]MBB4931961.1 hypothetical protein [Lipingzhangella halophila]
MIDEFRAAFQELIDASVATDTRRFPPAVHKVYTLASHVPSDERKLALEALVPLLGGTHAAPGVTADLTVVAGAMVEMGTPPGDAGLAVLRRLRTMGQGAAVFLRAWQQTDSGAPPDPEEVTSATEQQIAAELGDTAPQATVCWWTIRRHGLAAKTMLSESSVRAAIRTDPELHGELVTISEQLGTALWEFEDVGVLLQISQAVSALVLDRASGRGFRVRFDGISDNFQFHTLLADALVGEQGQGLEGHRPDERWTAAFRDSATDPEAPTVHGWWNLTAADGSRVGNEGTPADIPTVEGERAVVLDKPDLHRTWTAGRHYAQVHGSLEVSEELTPQQATQWWQRVAGDTPATSSTPEEPALGGDPPDQAPEEPPQRASAPTEAIPTVTEAPPEPGEGEHSDTPHEDEDAPAPGAHRMPPLPPGVSDNSGWGPTWL